LHAGTRLADVLQLAREIRAERPAAGLVIFSYLNPILRYGLSALPMMRQRPAWTACWPPT
jgi:tryptophan synthase alpha subunit